MRFSVFITLTVLALAVVGLGAASPQPTATNNSTAPIVEDVDPANATTEDVIAVAEWLRTDGVNRSAAEADRAREWLGNATAGVDVELGNESNATATATATATPTATPAPVESDGENTTRIDSATEIVGSEYDANRGVARITVRSEMAQAITFTDGALFADGGGKGTARSEGFAAGETSTVEIPVTEVNGRVGVAVSTENTPIYGLLIEDSGGGLDVLRALSPLQALLIGVVVAFVWMTIAGYSVMRRESGRPEVA